MNYNIKLLAILLVVSLLFCIFSTYVAATEYSLGDINADTKINSTDALLALKCATGSGKLDCNQTARGDVDDNFYVNSVDALLILQHSTGKLQEFPRKADAEDLYYSGRDHFYNVDGSDFEDRTVDDINDTDELIEKFGGEDYEAADVDGYGVNADNKLVYNRIEREAEQLGTLHKYDNAEKTTGTLTIPGAVMEYSMPTTFSAYDAVPIDYTIYSTDTMRPYHIEANAFEDPTRYQSENAQYYDCDIPGSVDVKIKYEGYVGATDNSNYPKWSGDYNDTLGTQYPSLDLNNEEPIVSGNIKHADRIWFKFSFTNTGNTILDSEGNGAFNFLPTLQKKGYDGNYTEVARIDDYMVRLYDYVYPGETGEFWLTFQDSWAGPVNGNYRIVIQSQVRNERSGSNWAGNYVGGITQCIDTFDFTISSKADVTTPNPVVHENKGSIPRNGWFGVYEEFMSTYHSLFTVSNNAAAPTTGTLYVQPASFTTNISIKLTKMAKSQVAIVHIPVNVTTDDVTITLNPYNENYYEKSDGTRTPLVATQNMVDMRANVQMGPYVTDTVINDLRDMQEAGINMLTSTCAFSYSSTQFDCFKFMMDATRSMDTFNFAGYISYPSNSDSSLNNAQWIAGNYNRTMTPWGVAGYNEANGIMAKFSYDRYGDLYWKNADGTVPLAMEDTWGWMTIDHDWRFGMVNDSAISQFTSWLKGAFGTVLNLNKYIGSSYLSFNEIDPRKDGKYESAMNAYNFTDVSSDAVFKDYSKATALLDVYRTVSRCENYEKVISNSGIEGAKIALRSEGSTWLAGGIKSTTTNMRYRQVYYEQRRNAAIPEIISASDTVYGCSNYGDMALSASETYELTKQSTKYGITMCKTSMMTHFRDIVINPTYGDSKYVTDYNLESKNLKGVCVDTMIALFPYMRSLYEGGGIPGVMWHDYYCDGFLTSTQYKELKFFSSKIEEMLATPEGQQWATDFEPTGTAAESGIWSYSKDYVDSVIANTERFCKYTESYK